VEIKMIKWNIGRVAALAMATQIVGVSLPLQAADTPAAKPQSTASAQKDPSSQCQANQQWDAKQKKCVPKYAIKDKIRASKDG
jgi:hypothetical protein